MVEKLIDILKEKHGEDLTFKEGESYYLFLKDGLFDVYLDEDTKTLKVNVEFMDEGKAFVYHSNERLEDLM